MANALFIDIETVPTPKALESLDKKAALESLGNAPAEEKPEDAIKKLSLSACTARVLCMGYAFNANPSLVISAKDAPLDDNFDEAGILTEFWMLARQTNLFVGYNILDFDLRFIWQRSMILGVKPTREIPFIRFRQAPVFDVMQEWHKWAYRDHVSLDVLARAFGIASPKADGIDGSKVYQYYCEGRLEEIFQYCQRDVETVREIYKRLTR